MRRSLIPWLLLAASVSCSSNAAPAPAAPTPEPGTGVAAAARPPAGPPPSTTPPGAPPADGRGGPPPGFQGGRPGGGRQQLTPEQRAARRDSATAERTTVITELSQRIAGYETRRSGDEFTNVTLMPDTTAAELLKTMDYYGRSLGVGCTYCHVAGDKWDDDTKEEKGTTRVMIKLVNLINAQGLSQLPKGRNGQTPAISCITCHRGNTRPGTALLP